VNLIETGAGQRRGSKLTAEGRTLVERFEKWHDQTVTSADRLFDKLFGTRKK
jgi:molybdenum-dependent DNA-binding transcriptional regulator ModE